MNHEQKLIKITYLYMHIICISLYEQWFMKTAICKNKRMRYCNVLKIYRIIKNFIKSRENLIEKKNK